MRRPSQHWPWVVLALGGAGWLLTVGHDPVAAVEPALRHAAPALDAVLGRDSLGRPVGARVAASLHVVVLPGLLAGALAVVGGLALGALGGWWGGLAARLVGVARDSLSALPDIVLALLLVLALGDGTVALVLGVGLAGVPGLAGAVAARIRQLRQADFVQASQLHGLSDRHILLRHLLWGACRGLAVRHFLRAVAAYVVLETTLAYLGGVGTQEPVPSWGNLLASLGPDPRAPAVARMAPVVAVWLTLASLHALARRTPDPGPAP